MVSAAAAQDDPNETPLGDVARAMRKKNPPAQKQVIDDDNLSQVMEQADRPRPFGPGMQFSMVGESKGFQMSVPDATCSLSFTANVKALLSSQYAQMMLPPSDMAKLEGQAAVEGDALTIPVFNHTPWHLSELAVAFTVVRKGRPEAGDLSYDGISSEPAAAFEQVRPEKKPDVTVIYRMRAAAPPWVKTTFSAPLDLELSPGDDWHWAIVEAKGYPPENYSVAAPAAAGNQVPAQSVPSSATGPQVSPADSTRQISQ
jgi:hypothetical protein